MIKLIGNLWDTVHWDENIYEGSGKAEDVEFLDANEIILPEERISALIVA